MELHNANITANMHPGQCVLSRILSLALLLLAFLCASSALATIGLVVMHLNARPWRGRPLVSHPTSMSDGLPEASRKLCFTILSSKEWKLMMARRPPGASSAAALGIACARASSSPFTAMRRAWKERVAGWMTGPLRRPPLLLAAAEPHNGAQRPGKSYESMSSRAATGRV